MGRDRGGAGRRRHPSADPSRRLARPDRARRPGRGSGAARPVSPYAVRLDGGDPGRLVSVKRRHAAVQEEGSQLCALGPGSTPLEGRDDRWLDLCAGRAGKTALMADCGCSAGPGSSRTSCTRIGRAGPDATSPGTLTFGRRRAHLGRDGGYDRVLLDAVHRARRAAPAPGSPLAAHSGRRRRAWQPSSVSCCRGAAPRPSVASSLRDVLAALAETRGIVAGADLTMPGRPSGLPHLGDGRPCSCGRTGHGTTRCSARCYVGCNRDRVPDR